MKTEELIHLLAADLEPSRLRFRLRLRFELACGAAVAAAILFVALRVRPDLAAQIGSPRLWLKFVATLSLSVASLGLVASLATPGAQAEPWMRALLVAPITLLVGVLAESAATPSSTWLPGLVGHNAAYCVTLIPLLSAAPLGCLLHVLKRGAPTQPGFAGAAAGLLAGGVGATLYALHCTDDSPFFVAFWYSLAIAAPTLVGFAVGRRLLVW